MKTRRQVCVPICKLWNMNRSTVFQLMSQPGGRHVLHRRCRSTTYVLVCLLYRLCVLRCRSTSIAFFACFVLVFCCCGRSVLFFPPVSVSLSFPSQGRP